MKPIQVQYQTPSQQQLHSPAPNALHQLPTNYPPMGAHIVYEGPGNYNGGGGEGDMVQRQDR